MLALTLTGLLGLGYEVVAIRVLAQVLENTVFTFASLLAVYLLGTAIGAAIYQRVGATNERTFVIIITGLTLSSTLGICALSVSRPLHLWLVETLGDGMVPGIAGEWIVALVVFLPPTLFMGASFAHLAQRARDRLGVGCALALNTLGAALAPVIFGVVLTPAIGSKLSLVVIAAGYLLLLLPTIRTHRITLEAGQAVVTLVGLSPLNLRVVTVPEGGQLLAFNEGRMANVAVVQDASTARFLKVNNQYTMGSTNSRFSDRRQAHIPLLMHPRPRNALFLGLGTGATFVAAAEHPELRATAVELLPELLPVLTHFGTSREDVEQHPNLNLVSADARRFVASSRELYDVIVADVFHPARDGAAALYTQEHFAAIRERLDKDGLFCQWLPLFQIDLTTLRSIVHTFVTTFPDAQMHLAHFSLGQPIIGLVGRRTPYRFEAGYLRKRRVEAALATELASVRLNNDFALLGGYLAGGNELAKFAQGAALNTDDHPAVAWSAPHFLFATPEPAYIRLLALVDALNARPDGLLDTMQVDAATVQRFAAYWKARDEYLRIGVDVTPTNNTRRMLEQIGQPLMRLVEASPEFSPAYLPLVQMAVELSATDPLVSKALLQRLEMAAPDRSEATEARRRLFFP